MRISELKKRLKKNRPMATITTRMPQDVVSHLKRLAPLFGFMGYQPLLRYYIGKGLREDIERLEEPNIKLLVKSLKRHGVRASIIKEALSEAHTESMGSAPQ
ncbi:MAG: hypothetical protein HY559_00885 [Gammaproteobacteria bacterium]|nr:hypothetical protein [Gammaproteobacteria bacterium]